MEAGIFKGQIFLFNKDENSLIPMNEMPYLQEQDLQDWLSGYPELIPGDQIDPENPRRWLLIKAEMGVPDREGGSDRWSLDHLFLDQDGIPTFVECKRSSDTRARRERPWTEEEFREKVQNGNHSENSSLVERFLHWARTQGYGFEGGQGTKSALLDGANSSQ